MQGGGSSARGGAGEGGEEVLSGSVSGVVYRNEQTGWTVLKVEISGTERAPDGSRTASLVGKAPTVWTGEDIRAVGRWERHPERGLRFAARSLECIAPTSAAGLERYLASGIVKGIGPKLAARIVKKFGTATLDVLERDSGRLAEVEGLGAAKRRALKAAWDANSGTRDAMVFLQGHGITSGTAAKIYRAYGEHTVAVVKRNPYRLCADIDGIGFVKADEIARKTGVPHDSPDRARAGIDHVLQQLADVGGHCFCERPDLLLASGDQLQMPIDILETAISEEVEAGRLVDDGGRIYLPRLYRAERRVAAKIVSILDTRPRFKPVNAAAALEWETKRLPFALSGAQARAVRMALENKFSVVTGGPGVGKTTIIRALCDIWGARRLDVKLVAPTGRAARRMAESTGRDAATIHKLLKWNPQKGRFVHNSENPLDLDVLVVDESSMIDIELASSLLSALQPSSTVVMVGDIDQLPSVGPGNVLRDAIASGVVPFTRLDAIFRQKTGGWIVRNAHRVNNGLDLEAPPRGEESDFFMIPCEDPARTLAIVMELVEKRIPRKWNFAPLADVQVLCPMHKNVLGTDSLNSALQAALNPAGPSLRRFGREYRVGDRVMQLRNDYDKDVSNGDIGFVKSVSEKSRSLVVDFDGREADYQESELDELSLAYAATIHKSQGSEYPAVVVVVGRQHYVMLKRNLLYTALTRGKKLVCIVGSPVAIRMAIADNDTAARRTALADRLKDPVLPPVAVMAPAVPAVPSAPGAVNHAPAGIS